MQKSILLFLFLSFLAFSCTSLEKDKNRSSFSVDSPNGDLRVEFLLTKLGEPAYRLLKEKTVLIDTSTMGFDLKNMIYIGHWLEVSDATVNSFSEKWEMPWGEQRVVENSYNELAVNLTETRETGLSFSIVFRVYDDGIGFRYEIPKWDRIGDIIVLEENTQFTLTSDPVCWWIPGDWDIYEHLYNKTRFSEIDAISKRNHPNLAQTYIPENAVNTPVTLKTDDGIYLSFHEAALIDYPDMTLRVNKEANRFESALVGSDRMGYKARVKLPFNTPWRTIQVSDDAGGLVESRLIVNLNEPNELGDVSWFKPKKYVGIWWEMHLDKSKWDYASGKHGATTENARKYIDFAAANNIGGVLVEGWNTGWEHWRDEGQREGVFDFVTPYPDYDLKGVVDYARSKGVEIIMHHETSSAPRTYDQQLDTAYALMQQLGIHSVKTGYVGKIIPEGEYHHGQWMVNHYRRVREKGAATEVAINAHEPIKATGLRRTFPNIISREGLRGQEFNAWASDGGNPPEHIANVVFTRMLAGPIDFTPGVFDIKFDQYKPDNQVNTTLAQQLALYVVLYSPIQMACDLPENYEGNPAFGFIRDVAVDWEQTKVLDGEVGDFVVIAREERGGGNWYLGAVTDENARDIEVDFDFLPDDVEFTAVIYKDAADSHWNDNPTAIVIEQATISNSDVQTFRLAPGGGLAISLQAGNRE